MKPTSRIRFPFRKEVRPLEDYQVIGHRWKCGNTWSLMILIGRGLDLNAGPGEGSKGKASESEQTGSNRNRKNEIN